MPDAITAIGSTPSTTLDAARQAQRGVAGPKQEMDQEVFLKLLVTQLQNQDPSSPMDTNQMVSQAAQLSMTETLNSISTTLQNQGAATSISTSAALIGQDVKYLNPDGTTVTGKVTGALFQNGQALVEIEDGTTAALHQIISITN
ncbi:flagellar hook capping protein (plasmid) [Citricoccus nitrophenolicus]